LWGATAQLAYATPFTFSLDFTKFGTQANFACGGSGACGAVATVNSFVFLENMYSHFYDNKLTPSMNLMDDAQDFGFDGWQVGANSMRRGYYDPLRPHNADFTDSFLQTKKEWIHDRAPGTTIFESWFEGSPDHNRKPTIMDLAQEIKDGEDVEFFVRGTNFYHVLTLTEVSCDMAMNCSIRYQDPNQPLVNQPGTPITVMDGMLQFTNVPGSGHMGVVTITAAFSESPVPEPSTLLLLGSGLAVLVVWRRKQLRG
jgi:hypothetical protein